MENLQERITKKEQQIAKMEKNLVKYVESEEFTKICDRFFETGDKTELNNYKVSHNMWCYPEYYSKRYALEDAKKTLAKYQQMLVIENNKKATLNELPQVIVQFRDNLIERWNAYDIYFKNLLEKEYKEIGYNGMHEKYKYQHIDWYTIVHYTTEEQIKKQNEKDANNLILNMINRTIELTGKIIDCKNLYLDRDNQGYAVINGIIIGENGKAKIESIGAGGYNIQRYHIRVLVKEVR